MNKIQENTEKKDHPQIRNPRHPLTQDNPKEVMFARMASVKERIAVFEKKLNANRKKERALKFLFRCVPILPVIRQPWIGSRKSLP